MLVLGRNFETVPKLHAKIAENVGNHGNDQKRLKKVTKYLTKLKETLKDYVWKESHVKTQ